MQLRASRQSVHKVVMKCSEQIAAAELALTEFRREIAGIAPDEVDLLEIERRTQKLLNGYGRALMREAMARADPSAPEVTINGET